MSETKIVHVGEIEIPLSKLDDLEVHGYSPCMGLITPLPEGWDDRMFQ